MLLCFFALSANMSANLMEQTKEIGVMRAMGLKKYRVQFLYFYEAIILVFASSMMGVMIGMVVAYTLAIQESLILDKELSVFFPWEQFIVVLILSLVCAFFSTITPTY